ncbi:ABC transporter permease subunit [Frankia sp. CNm7]|uniref:ABC transporter permease subunit n=1 Tax=Frankia nepalensis TaxID=1836974 RepID=A0A937RHS9_9ACTN|nr:ABC transporter permease subunit [Frankia nepalensis]MBL7495501.1 ABC transporter permease subunit [Frankia nepalensis]MBL7510870.1 ABC transporter permease subunit [Frankia nepalensis]MBL7520403.1 ABC transporter permease subunit [Frankia nepalensis]MBL7630605.1 ABC transporter permease subunit [Frankia nepalensis]
MTTLQDVATSTAGGAAGARRGRLGGAPPWLGGLVGTVAVIALWWILALTWLRDGGAVPTPDDVLVKLVTDFDRYIPSIKSTLWIAIKGFLIGNGLAIGLAILTFGIPVVDRIVLQIGVASYCLPIIAIGPILTTVFDGSTPQVALAGISVFFTTLIGTLVGLRGADQAALDVIRASGGGRIRQLRYVRLRAALPSTFAALQIAAPAAVLGAIIGEYLGADRGLGVAMVAAQQNLNVAGTWALAFISSAAAGIGYGLIALIGRLLTPWAPRTNVGGGS